MITNRPVALITSILLSLGGCGGSGSGGGAGPGPGGPTSRYLYVSAYQFPSSGTVSGEIYGFKFDPGSGGLTDVVGSPFGANTSGAPIAISRDAKFVYTSNYLFSNNQFSNTSLIALSVQADGTLVPVPGSPLATSGPISNVFTNPALDYLYAVNAFSLSPNNLTVYSIDPSTGALTEQPSNPIGSFGPWLAITPDGKYLYSIGPEIYEFSIDPASGALSPMPGSPVAVPNYGASGPAGVAIDPAGKFLYVTNSTQFTGFGGPMEAWSIDPQSGALNLISEFQPTAGPQGSLAIDASGKYVIVDTPVTSKTGLNCFSVLSIDPANGMLANVPGSPFPDFGGSCGLFVADPSAQYVYAAGPPGRRASSCTR